MNDVNGVHYGNQSVPSHTAPGRQVGRRSLITCDDFEQSATRQWLKLADVEESPTRYIHVQNGKIQVCDTDLGFEVDVYIESTLQVMTQIWYGELDMHSAIDGGQMTVKAAPVYSRQVKRWLGISSFTTNNPSLDALASPARETNRE